MPNNSKKEKSGQHVHNRSQVSAAPWWLKREISPKGIWQIRCSIKNMLWHIIFYCRFCLAWRNVVMFMLEVRIREQMEPNLMNQDIPQI